MELTINNHTVFAATGREEFNPTLPNIIFIHGAGLDHTVWTLFNRYFAKKQFNSIAIDLPGHGRSRGAPLPSVEVSARWLLDFMQTLEMEETALVGHSMGALIALEAAYQAQAGIDRIVLLGAAAPMPVAAPLLSAARAHDQRAVDMIMSYAHAWCSQLGGNPVPGIHIMNSNRRVLERHLENILFADLNACNEYTNGATAARNIGIPAYLILGAEDRMAPATQATELINALARAKVESLADCGHLMPSEQPEAVHRALARIFRV